MSRTITTNAIRASRALGRPPSQSWVDWATQLLAGGADTPALRMLAGYSAPFDERDITSLVDRSLVELGIPYVDKAAAVEAYATELVESILLDRANSEAALAELFALCVETNYSGALYNFYLLRCARDDLRDHGMQAYWDGADQSNIDDIIHSEALRWLQLSKSERLARILDKEKTDSQPSPGSGGWPGFERDPLHRAIDWFLAPLRRGK